MDVLRTPSSHIIEGRLEVRFRTNRNRNEWRLRVGSRHSRLISFTTKQNLHDFRYEGGAPINSRSQITPVNEKRKYGPSQQARTT